MSPDLTTITRRRGHAQVSGVSLKLHNESQSLWTCAVRISSEAVEGRDAEDPPQGQKTSVPWTKGQLGEVIDKQHHLAHLLHDCQWGTPVGHEARRERQRERPPCRKDCGNFPLDGGPEEEPPYKSGDRARAACCVCCPMCLTHFLCCPPSLQSTPEGLPGNLPGSGKTKCWTFTLPFALPIVNKPPVTSAHNQSIFNQFII